MKNEKLSIIIPVYRGETFIKKNLVNFKKSVQNLKRDNLEIEFIVVVDGEVDKSAGEAKSVKGIRVLSYKKNRGKGYAIKYGFKHSSGDYILFLDSDGDFNPEQINNFFPYLAAADIVLGSKRHPFSKIHYPLFRKFLSTGFQILSKLILGINLRDTQSGLKIFKREVLEIILPLLKIDRYAFDLEICFLAMKHGFRMVEAPIKINFQNSSNINVRVPLDMFFDLLKIRYRYSVTKYYQKKFHKEKLNF